LKTNQIRAWAAESGVWSLRQGIAAGYFPPDAIHLLIDQRSALPDDAAARLEKKISPIVKLDFVHALDAEFDRRGICAGSHGEVIFQLALVAVVIKVHARIDLLVLHLAKVGNVSAPTFCVTADEIVTACG